MENGSSILLSSQRALRQRMDVVANNIANMNTPGFKASKPVFSTFLSKTFPGDQENYVDFEGTYIDYAEGAMTPTGNKLDIALGGKDFLVINTPQGDRYTRAGHFQLDADRQLVNASGYPVQGEGGNIVIPPNVVEILINEDGSVTADGQNIGRLRIVHFEDKITLRKSFGNMFVAGVTPVESENPRVFQGMLESSNVQAISEVTEMMNVLRSYQSIGRATSKEDERIRKMIDAYTRK